ncbi:hypothetical protein DL93DRAFT_2229454 [Clavulina sp. PMI_390]|nr:hypothetical protein DL93DRAFT_2229454 [Clavulina sp. PMI_390]
MSAPINIGTAYYITSKQTGTAVDWNQFDLLHLVSWQVNGGASQQWLIEDAGSGRYYIRSCQGSQPYITFSGSGANAAPLICNATKTPWQIVKDTDPNCYRILNQSGSLCMDLWGNNPANGATIGTYPISGTFNEAWIFKPVPLFNPDLAPFFFLTNYATGTAADLAGDNKSVICNTKGASPNQIWTTEVVDKARNIYYIRNVTQGTYLSITGGPYALNPLVTSACPALWEIRPNPSATDPSGVQVVRLHYQASLYLADLTGSNTVPGTPILLNLAQDPGSNQQWKIEAAT